MKFFTRDLFAAFASDEARIAEQADEAWESAIERYRKHLARIKKQLSHELQKLAGDVCLHDARYLGFSKIAGPFSGAGVAIIMLKRQDDFVVLFYLLVNEPTFSTAQPGPAFDVKEVVWLYDEVDALPNGVFSHEILLSDGTTLALQFLLFDLFVVDNKAAHHQLVAEFCQPTPLR